MKNIMLISVIISFFSIHSFSQTFYVDDSGGSDGANGSSGTPWATLQHASDQIGPGDTVIVRSGNYAGFVRGWDFFQSGTSSKPVVFKAEAGATITSKNNKTADGINLEGASYIVIDGFTISNTGTSITRAGIRCVDDTGVILRNNIIDGMGTWGILTGHSESILIENNKTSHSGSQHGIYFGNSADNAIIRGNTSFGNTGCGIHMNSDASMGGDGIISDALVENNIIYDNGFPNGGAAINMDGVQNSKVINNLLYNNHAGGITLFQIDGAEPAKNNLIYNNTIIQASDGRWAININSGSSGNTVYNNIILSKHASRGSITVDALSLSGFKSDYNAVSDRFSADDDNSIITFADWKTQTGQDQHSFIANNTELFNNAGSDDYSIKSGCKAVNTGTALVSAVVTKDIEQKSRPMGTGFDVGCYEFTEGVLTYTLTVMSGTGSGSYTVGQVVNISANTPPSGKVFDKWTGATAGIANINLANTTIIMPAANVSITATYKNSSGLDNNDISETAFYPNPVSDVINFNQTGKVSIYDLNGVLKIAKFITCDKPQIDISGLSCGLYIIKISNDNGTITNKFIKE